MSDNTMSSLFILGAIFALVIGGIHATRLDWNAVVTSIAFSLALLSQAELKRLTPLVTKLEAELKKLREAPQDVEKNV